MKGKRCAPFSLTSLREVAEGLLLTYSPVPFVESFKKGKVGGPGKRPEPFLCFKSENFKSPKQSGNACCGSKRQPSLL